jgi:hypothetical protein
MHAIRRLLAVTSAMLAFAVLAPPASQAAETRSLTVTKQCLGPAGPPALLPGELEYCTITASNFSRLIGAKIRYFGPGFVTEDHLYLDSRVLIEGTGGTAFGHCLVRIVSAVAPPAGAGSLSVHRGERLSKRVQSRCDRHHCRLHDLELEWHPHRVTR